MQPPTVGSSAAAELQQLLIDTEIFTRFLTELAQYAAATLGPGLSCGITLRRDGSPFTVAASDPTATSLDEVQYGHHDGPCLAAMRTRQVVVLTDVATETRWGTYRVDALAHGIGSVLSVPLMTGPSIYGALNLYAREPGIFTAQQRARAEGFAGEASRALHLAWRLGDQ
jgi:GAF domain-containing protein